MTIHFPDISSFQREISLKGAPAVAIKATEGTGWKDPYFTGNIGRAHRDGAWPIAYHFLHAGSAAQQATWLNGHDGGLPAMLDLEPTGSSHPSVADGCGFIDAYRKGGGVCNLLYLPNWYWQQLGRPSLAPFKQRGMALWSSAYPGSYDDHGSGWAAYGGMDVIVWQWTDKHPFNGQNIDFSAYKGTLAQFRQLATGGHPAPAADPNPTLRKGDSGPAVTKAQQRLNAWGARLTADGQFGDLTDKAVRAFQGQAKIGVDGVIGPATWAHLNANPKAPAATPTADPTKARPWHGVWVSAGQASLDGLAKNLGYSVNSLLRMTAVHFGAFDPKLAGYVAGLANGTVKPADHLPAGATVWAN